MVVSSIGLWLSPDQTNFKPRSVAKNTFDANWGEAVSKMACWHNTPRHMSLKKTATNAYYKDATVSAQILDDSWDMINLLY